MEVIKACNSRRDDCVVSSESRLCDPHWTFAGSQCMILLSFLHYKAPLLMILSVLGSPQMLRFFNDDKLMRMKL